MTLKGHSDSVNSVAFSPDGQRLASASSDQDDQTVGRGHGQETMTLNGHMRSVLSVAFSPDGKRLASGSTDKTIKLWDVATGQETMTLKGHANYGHERRLQPRRPAPRLWKRRQHDQAVGRRHGTGNDDIERTQCSREQRRLQPRRPAPRLWQATDKTIKLWDARPLAEKDASLPASQSERNIPLRDRCRRCAKPFDIGYAHTKIASKTVGSRTRFATTI